MTSDDETALLAPLIRAALRQVDAYYRERAAIRRWLESTIAGKVQPATAAGPNQQ